MEILFKKASFGKIVCSPKPLTQLLQLCPGLPHLLEPDCARDHTTLPSHLPQHRHLQTGSSSIVNSLGGFYTCFWWFSVVFYGVFFQSV